MQDPRVGNIDKETGARCLGVSGVAVYLYPIKKHRIKKRLNTNSLTSHASFISLIFFSYTNCICDLRRGDYKVMAAEGDRAE